MKLARVGEWDDLLHRCNVHMFAQRSKSPWLVRLRRRERRGKRCPCQPSMLAFGDKPQTAPVRHFQGPLTIGLRFDHRFNVMLLLKTWTLWLELRA